MSALFTAAIGTQQHAGRVEAAISRQTDLRGTHTDIAARFAGFEKSLKPTGVGDRIVIEGRYKWSVRSANPLVDGRSKAQVLVVRDNSSEAVCGTVRGDQVLAAIIDNNNFKVVQSLLLE